MPENYSLYKMFTLKFPRSVIFDPSHIVKSMDAIEKASLGNTWWQDTHESRFSIVGCIRIFEYTLAGFITQSHLLNQREYTDNKTVTETELNDYEDRLFILDLIEQRVILEWRRFSGISELSLPLLQRRAARILNDLLPSELTLGQMEIVPLMIETSNQQFQTLFFEHPVIEITVDDFGTHVIAPDVRLVNPNPDMEGAAREFADHDRDSSDISRVVVSAASSRGDIRRAILARLALYGGNPKKLVYASDDGVKVRTRRSKAEFYSASSEEVSARERAAITLMRKVDEQSRSIDIDLPRSERVDDSLPLFNETDQESDDLTT